MPEPIDLTTPEWSVSAVKPGPTGSVDVVAAVAAAMAELPAIGKDSKAAKEQGGYAYRGIEAITGHLQALLAKHKVLTIPRAEILATVPSVGMNEGWTDTTLRVEWLIAGADGSSFTAVTNGIGRDKSDKGANKAQTQAHKYLLLPLFCIADRKDDADGDSYEDGRADPRTTAEPAASKEQLDEIHRLGVVSTPAQWDRFVAWSKDEKLPPQDRLTARQADRAIARLTEIVAPAAEALDKDASPEPDPTLTPAPPDVLNELEHLLGLLGGDQRTAVESWLTNQDPTPDGAVSRATALAAIKQALELKSSGTVDPEPAADEEVAS